MSLPDQDDQWVLHQQQLKVIQITQAFKKVSVTLHHILYMIRIIPQVCCFKC